MREPVLILGASGFIGQTLVGALVAMDIPVIAVGTHCPGIRHPLVEHLPIKIEGVETLSAPLARAGMVVHLATVSTPGTSSAKPLQEVEKNLRTTAVLLECLQQHPGKGLMYFSSGGSLYADIGRPSDENSPIRPRSYHGAAKLAAESFISSWCSQFGGSATILRPSNVYGPGQTEKAGFGVIPATMGKIVRNETMNIWGDGTARRDYIYIDDLARLCISILTSQIKPGVEILNACCGKSVSLNELIHVMEQVTGQTLDRVYEHTRAVDATNIAMDPSQAMRAYGWKHRTSIIDGLTHTWKWFQREYSTKDPLHPEGADMRPPGETDER